MDNSKNLTIKGWSEEDQPREKLRAAGKKSITTAELIAILLRSGSIGKDAVSLSQEILSQSDNSLIQLSKMEVSDFMKFNGIGEAKAITIMAALELGWRMTQEQNEKKSVFIHESRDAFLCINHKIIDIDHEEFWALFLDVRNKVIGKQLISLGGLTQTIVDIRTIFRLALEQRAVSVIVAHNHPSGSLTPSKQDDALTKQIYDAGDILRIKLLDHLVVGINDDGKASYYSYRDHGIIR